MTCTRIAQLVLAGLIVVGLARSLPAQWPKPTIVLVHGAFADRSSWQRVIPILQRDSYTVIAVQNPLTTLAAAGNPSVKALVYIAAFAPEAGEPIGAFGQQYPAPLGAALKPDAAGFLYIDPGKFHDVFAADLPLAETRVMAATQKPIIGNVFGASVQQATWKNIPSWYLVTQDDLAMNPDLQRFYAKRLRAKATEVKSSHVPFLSHPAEVARFIEQAAGGSGR